MEVSGIHDIVVIGAGPAGAAAALVANSRGLRVALLESGRYPRHKVCGEFVSAESAEVLRALLRSDDILASAPRIRTSRLHSGGRTVSMTLNEPAYSIPRIQLDECLWKEAVARGIDCRNIEAKGIEHHADCFRVITADGTLTAHAIINASGRWSRITQPENNSEPWIGLKAHFRGETDDAVDLYFMDDGYCGVQAVSPGVLNACALMKQGSAKQLADVFLRDQSLLSRSQCWEQTTETFATAPVFLELRSPVRNGILQVGDAAGFVDPFVGDGISLALRSGALAGRTVLDREPEEFADIYLRAFSSIFRNTRRIRSALRASSVFRPLLLSAVRVPGIAKRVFHSTRAAQLDVLNSLLPRVN